MDSLHRVSRSLSNAANSKLQLRLVAKKTTEEPDSSDLPGHSAGKPLFLLFVVKKFNLLLPKFNIKLSLLNQRMLSMLQFSLCFS